jgi:hypothetical protein
MDREGLKPLKEAVHWFNSFPSPIVAHAPKLRARTLHSLLPGVPCSNSATLKSFSRHNAGNLSVDADRNLLMRNITES